MIVVVNVKPDVVAWKARGQRLSWSVFWMCDYWKRFDGYRMYKLKRVNRLEVN
jgi:hypothetical protein